MRGKRQDVANLTGRTQSGRRAAVAALLLVCTVAAADASSSQNRLDRRSQDRLDELRRREGEALLNLADAAMAGRAPSDFSIAWSNDFFKAQTGTFVPFTVTIDRSALTAADALMYVRAARRDGLPARGRDSLVRYPFDIIFPVALSGTPGQPLRVTRGFAVAPGDYDVYVALRERAADPLASDRRLKGAVLKQPLTVPDFWTGELATSTVMLADRIDPVATPVTGDDVLERPYVIGSNEVHRAAGDAFRRDRELIVVFLIYNSTVSADKSFDIEVDYHLFRKDGGAAQTVDAAAEGDHPPARAGERYVTRTTPQRFTPAVMAADFDPASGPIMAGQGILLSSFQEGEYRLGITVTDVMSRKSLSRDVTFRVVGS
jgi:hypothetical protein